MTPPLLEFSDIGKSFFGVKVLKGVSFSVPAGGAVGLVGENGAGKSTLMNILGGNLATDTGRMRFAGVDYRPGSPQDAERKGIAFIHQELNLFSNLTIAENLFLTGFPRVRGTPLIARNRAHRRAAELLREVGLDAPPQRLVETLTAGERQLVEIAKALSLDARLVIFDEPTTSLGVRETERLFRLIPVLRGRGLAVIYISHVLAEIFQLCEDVVVLRDGEVVGKGATSAFTTDRLISLMVGRPLRQLFPLRDAESSARATPGGSPPPEAGQRITLPVLEVRGVTRSGIVEDVSFALGRGEVLGLFGLMGAGRSELARLVFGLDNCTAGEVRLNGQPVSRLAPRELIRRGVAFVTENRHREGLFLEAGVSENLSLVNLPQYSRGPLRWLLPARLEAAVQHIRAVVKFDSKARNDQPVRTLSGGNQQKVVLGKWLLREPTVLLLDEPTRGIDVGARHEVYRLIHALADQGAGVLVISSEIEELMGLCGRILVMRRGCLHDELSRAEFDRERILRAALGTEASR